MKPRIYKHGQNWCVLGPNYGGVFPTWELAVEAFQERYCYPKAT